MASRLKIAFRRAHSVMQIKFWLVFLGDDRRRVPVRELSRAVEGLARVAGGGSPGVGARGTRRVSSHFNQTGGLELEIKDDCHFISTNIASNNIQE